MSVSDMSFSADISIHAPVKGATEFHARHADDADDFNPRTREGCDAIGAFIRIPVPFISIHAPVKGATLG